MGDLPEAQGAGLLTHQGDAASGVVPPVAPSAVPSTGWHGTLGPAQLLSRFALFPKRAGFVTPNSRELGVSLPPRTQANKRMGQPEEIR